MQSLQKISKNKKIKNFKKLLFASFLLGISGFLELPETAAAATAISDATGTLIAPNAADTGLKVNSNQIGIWTAWTYPTVSTSIYVSGYSLGGWLHFPAVSTGNGAHVVAFNAYTNNAKLATAVAGALIMIAEPSGVTPTSTCTDHATVVYTEADVKQSLPIPAVASTAIIQQFQSQFNWLFLLLTGASTSYYMPAGTTDLWACYQISSTSTFTDTSGDIGFRFLIGTY